MKVVDYYVCWFKDFAGIEKEVRELISQGWQPEGPLSKFYRKSDDKEYYYQVMIKIEYRQEEIIANQLNKMLVNRLMAETIATSSIEESI